MVCQEEANSVLKILNHLQSVQYKSRVEIWGTCTEKGKPGKLGKKTGDGPVRVYSKPKCAGHLGSVHFGLFALFLERVGAGDPKRMKELFMNRRDTRMGW